MAGILSNREPSLGAMSISSANSHASSSSNTSKNPDLGISPELLSTYNDLMSSRLPVSGTLQALSAGKPVTSANDPVYNSDDEDEAAADKKPMTKAEKQNAKKKRRKERERLAKLAAESHMVGESSAGRGQDQSLQREAESVPFRLFSSHPIHEVRLQPKPEDYPLPLNPRFRPISQEAARRVKRFASEAAVELPNLGGPSTFARKWTKSDFTPRKLSIPSDALRSRIMLLDIECHRSSDRYSRASATKLAGTDTAVSIASKTTKGTAATDTTSARKATRRGRGNRRSTVVANKSGSGTGTGRGVDRRKGYWTPKKGLGGKTMMTMWGYGVGIGSIR